eukprot:6792419-Prymnesium_polylepis.1
MDQLYGELQAGMTARADEIVAERKTAAAAARKAKQKAPPVNLTNADLPRVINGVADAPLEKRPFSYVYVLRL